MWTDCALRETAAGWRGGGASHWLVFVNAAVSELCPGRRKGVSMMYKVNTLSLGETF